MAYNMCFNCYHEKKSFHECAELNCNFVKRTAWRPKQMEVKEQDYSFNQSIMDALKEGKTVWAKCKCGEPGCDQWLEFNHNQQVLLSAYYSLKWSLTKPKAMVKKTVERWVNVYAGDLIASVMHTTEEEAIAGNCETAKHRYIKSMKLTGEYEVEE
jgi:hypothetical protein